MTTGYIDHEIDKVYIVRKANEQAMIILTLYDQVFI